jgi:hypothetical protein
MQRPLEGFACIKTGTANLGNLVAEHPATPTVMGQRQAAMYDDGEHPQQRGDDKEQCDCRPLSTRNR